MISLTGLCLLPCCQLPLHVRTGRELFCDAGGNPYPEALQAAFRAGRLLAAPWQDAVATLPGQDPSWLAAAPTLTAAYWAVTEAGGSEHAAQQAADRAWDRLVLHEQELDAGADAAAARRALAQQEQERRVARAAARAAAEEAALAAEEGAGEDSSGDEYVAEDGEGEESEDLGSDAMLDEEGEGSEGEMHGERRSRRQAARRRRGAAAARGPLTRSHGPAVHRGPAAEVAVRAAQQRSEREARLHRRQAQMAAQRHQRQAAVASGRSGGAHDQEHELSSEEESSEEEAGGYPARPGSRAHRRAARTARRRARESQRAARASGARPPLAYSWLAVCDHTPGVYVPQAGDDVVYLREGHAQASRGRQWRQWRQRRHAQQELSAAVAHRPACPLSRPCPRPFPTAPGAARHARQAHGAALGGAARRARAAPR